MGYRETLRKALDGKGDSGPYVVRLIVFFVLLSTVSFALDTVEDLHNEYEAPLTFCEAAATLVFSIEYILRLLTAEEGIFWIFTPMAIVDLCSILPSWLDVFIPGDAFPGFQFLRMLRVFKFLSSSKRGEAGAKAFEETWSDNKDLLLAASMAGGAVWVVTAALQYVTEGDNPDMLWCYPPPAPGQTYSLLGHSHDEHKEEHKMNCVCDGDGCTGSDCICESRFRSIPSAMFQVILNLSGEFPLADKYSFWGRIIASFTAIMSVAVFAIPTGLVGAAIEGAVGALDSGDAADYDVDDDDVAEIVAAVDSDDDVMKQPAYTKTSSYKKLTGVLVLISSVCSVLGTVKAVRHGLGDGSIAAFFMFYAVNVLLSGFFLFEWVMRVLAGGLMPTLSQLFSLRINMCHVDVMAWLPGHSADTDSGYPMLPSTSEVPYFPGYVTLTAALFQMIKFERYVHGFKILNRVMEKSQGILMIGGMAAAVVLVFSSALMYYAERHNPDPNMSKYYSSVPRAMWVTLLNLSGEAPLSDYTTLGSIIVGTLSITACAIFAIPVGALGSGFEAVISEITSEQETAETNPESELKNDEELEPSLTPLQRLVDGHGPRGMRFMVLSLAATLFAVGLEIWSTWCINMLEFVVVIWFTIEYTIRFSANGADYVFSMYGFVDFVSTFPYYAAKGLLGSDIADTMDVYDGPLRALRILRLIRLDAYVPSLTLIDDAVRNCWSGLSVALFSGAVIWFMFNETLFYAENGDVEEGEDKRFRNALSSLQYSGVLLTGDYPLVDFSPYGRIICSIAVVVAVGIVAVPASILAGAFVDLLQEQAETKSKKSGNPSAFQALIKDAMEHSKELRGLDSSTGEQPFFAKLCIWKNNRHTDHENSHLCGISGVAYKGFLLKLVFANIIAVILESIPEFAEMLPHQYWQSFEAVSVLFFTVEYLIDVGSAKYDPAFGFSRWQFMNSFMGRVDILSIIPFYAQTIIIPFFFGGNSDYAIDATIFRILRLARILEFDIFYEQFNLISEVFKKAGPVLKATGVLALILWVGGATAFYYVDPHNDRDVVSEGGEDPAVLTSIVDSLYYTSIFMAGEWCLIDFTPIGSFICVIMAMFGVLFEGFQDLLEEKHGKKDKKD
eukprot:GSChrysophyteH1.ASY1.ANO1.3286.1 assembled CDS